MKIQLKIIFSNILKHLIFISIGLITLFPIYFIISTTLKDKKEYLINKIGLPSSVTLTNIKELIQNNDFPIWFMNSTVITLIVVLVGTFICCLASFGLARFNFKFKLSIIRLIISLMVIPPIIALIPLFEFFVKIKLVNNYFGAIFVYLGFIIPFTVYLIYSFFITIPRELVEAATIDGCGNFFILFKIYLPLSLPVIITTMVVNASWVWNDLLIAMTFLQSKKLRTLMAGFITFRSRTNIDIPLTTSGLFVATIPIVLLFLISQKFFTKGIMSGIEK